MKYILFLLIPIMLMAQARTYLPVPVVSSSGRGFNNETVVIYPTGTTTGGKTLTYLSGSNGAYYWTGGSDSVSAGAYDIYVNGILWRSNISLNEDVLSADVRNKVLGNADDTGFDSVGVYEHITSMKVYNVKDYGAYSDSTNGVINNTVINAVMDSAYADGNAYVYIPPGKYLFDGRIYVNPNVPFIGAGRDRTQFYMADETDVFISPDNTNNAATDWKDRNYYISGFSLNGQQPYDNAENSSQKTARTDAGVNFQFTAAEPANQLIIRDVRIRKIGKEAIKAVFVYDAEISDCSVINNNHIAYTLTGHKIKLFNCTADTAYGGAELAAIDYTWPQTYDTLTSAEITHCNFNNMFTYGAVIYSGDQINFSDFIITMPDTGTFTRDVNQPGLFIKPNYLYGDIGNVNISNGFIKNSGGDGIYLGTYKSAAHTGQRLGNVNVDNVQIYNSYGHGIKIDPDTTGNEADSTGFISVRNSIIVNSNRRNLSAQSLVRVYNTDDVLIENNIIINPDASTASSYSIPILLTNCDDVIIRNNNLGVNLQRVWADSLSDNLQLYNNSGLRTHDAYYDYQNTTGYWQQWTTTHEGLFVSGGKSEIAYKIASKDNSDLYATEYNTSGDSSGIFLLSRPLDAITTMSASSKSDTLSLPVGSGWAWVTNGTDNFWSNSSYNASGIFDTRGDSVTVSETGTYKIEAQIVFRSLTSDTNRIEFTYGLNGSTVSAPGSITATFDSLYHTLTILDFRTINEDDVVKLYMRNTWDADDVALLRGKVFIQRVR